MKVKVYMRVAKDRRGRTKVVATSRPSPAPLHNSDGPLPTVAFGVELDLPDVMFRQAEQVIATLTIPESEAEIAMEVLER